MRQLLALLLIVVATGASADGTCICLRCAFGTEKMYRMPSTSMEPALSEGECTRFPVFDAATMMAERGDLVVYSHSVTGADHVFRVIGLPGDQIQLRHGRVWLNGTRLETRSDCETCTGTSYMEILPGGPRYMVRDTGQTALDNTELFVVPANHVFVLGDNRDNAADSRLTTLMGGAGMVAEDAILGLLRPDS